MELYNNYMQTWFSVDEENLSKEQSLMVVSQELGWDQWDGYDDRETEIVKRLEELGWVYKPDANNK